MGPEFEPQPDPYINSSALGADATAGDKRSSWVASVVNDKATRSLPNIIQSFRNSRLSTGYDEPTYFGFALDIHSQLSEAKGTINPYTGLKANPLFYLPEWAKMSSDGSGITEVNTGKNFPDLLANASEACAIQYLNSFSLKLSETNDVNYPKNLLLNSAAASTITNRPAGELNRGFYLMEFIKTLNSIQEKSPWAFKELDGIPNLWKACQAGYKFEPITLTIVGDETVDLRLTRLAEAYRLLSYDSFNGRKVLPPNLEKFSMDIYFMDLRFLKNGENVGLNINAALGLGSSAQYDETFSGQVNFGGIAFRCMGCRFDFSDFLENAAQTKSSTGESSSNLQPKIKIIVDRVMPATYFGDKAFGTAGFFDDEAGSNPLFGGLGGALDLGPFTGGITRVLSAGRRALTNILGAPQRALNDALLGLERQFDAAVDGALSNGPLNSRPFDQFSPTDLTTVTKERGANPINDDVYVGSQLTILMQRKVGGKITKDTFPGKDTRTTLPIKNDIFPGKDTRTALPIKNDMFPGKEITPIGKINNDIFPGDVPIMKAVNQRKVGGKITSQNPLKP
jgi:hypothetical protein